MRYWVCAALVVAVSVALAQEAPPTEPDDVDPSPDSLETVAPQPAAAAVAAETFSQASAAEDPNYTPLTLKQKWLSSVSEIFGPSRLAAYGVHAIIDYALNVPKQWGRSGDSLAVRAAGHFGDSFIRYNVQFAIQATDHEDPRYFRSGQHGGWKRTKYAVVHTFVVRRDDQSWMPAYSLIATAYGMPYIVRQWRPERFHNMDGFEAGTMGIGIAMGSNIFNEFWPDVRKKLPKTRFLPQR